MMLRVVNPAHCPRRARWRLLVAGIAALGCVAPIGSVAQAAGYRFLAPTLQAQPGDAVRYTIRGDHEQAAQGFSFAFRFPGDAITIDRLHLTDTILEAIEVDYFEKKVSQERGMVAVGLLVDTKPPFEGNLIPAIGRPLDFVHIEMRIASTAAGTLRLPFEDGLFEPPIDNLYSVNNAAIYVTELGEGKIVLPGGQGAGASFLRGDFNMDAKLDISDPIGILGYTFFGGAEPPCAVAGDVNDDNQIDISDPIFLLSYLFSRGPTPPAPFGAEGEDPTPGELACNRSSGI